MPPGLPNSSNNSLLLEEPLIRTPYELLRRSHRSAQRQVEKDFKGVQTLLSGLLKSFDDKPIPQDKRAGVVTKLDQGIERFRGLKRKLDDLQPNEAQPNVLKARLRYLDSIIASGATDRQVEIKVEPPEDSAPPPAATTTALINIKTEPDVDLSESAGGDPVKKENQPDEEMPMADRASSPLAPEPVHEDMNIARYLVDYLLRKGYMKSAQAVTDEASVEQLVDIGLFTELRKIESAMTNQHSVAEALAWCGENRGTLKKTKNNLEFSLRMQEFIELCRQRKVKEAIVYSRKNLAPWAATHLVALQQAMTLLAFGEKSGVNAYRQLYDASRWEAVTRQFRQTFLSLYGLPSQPLLCLSSFAGLAALRLPSCARSRQSPTDRAFSATQTSLGNDRDIVAEVPNFDIIAHQNPWDPQSASHTDLFSDPQSDSQPDRPEKSHEMERGHINCPSCDPHLRVLAKRIPMSHHVNSTIVCRISGEVMDSQNEPMAFPNGNVYSSNALTQMAKRNHDVVTCPTTGETCAFAKLRKVYIA